MAKGTVNKVTLIGRLGQDPEIRFTGDGAAIASFSVATNESWKSKDGETQERTEWTKVTVFGSTAEKYVQPYVKKGTLVYIEGSLKTDKWQDKEGNDRYTTEIVASEMRMLGKRGENMTSTDRDNDPVNKENTMHSETKNDSAEFIDDDIPF